MTDDNREKDGAKKTVGMFLVDVVLPVVAAALILYGLFALVFWPDEKAEPTPRFDSFAAQFGQVDECRFACKEQRGLSLVVYPISADQDVVRVWRAGSHYGDEKLALPTPVRCECANGAVVPYRSAAVLYEEEAFVQQCIARGLPERECREECEERVAYDFRAASSGVTSADGDAISLWGAPGDDYAVLRRPERCYETAAARAERLAKEEAR